MPTLSYPYTFEPNTTAASAQVNANFNAVASIVNGELDSDNIASLEISKLIGTVQSIAANGYVTLPGGLILQWGTFTDVPCDGSAVSTQDLPYTFPNAAFGFVPVALNADYASSAPYGLSAQAVSTSTTEIVFVITGGPSGSTCSAFFLAVGY